MTPLGNDLATTARAVAGGRRATVLETPFGAGEAAAARVTGLDARPHFRFPKALKLADERTRHAVAAASMAWRDAALAAGAFDPARAGVLVGTSGSDLRAEDLARALADDPELRAASDVPEFAARILGGLNPLWLLLNLPNMVSAHLAIQLGLKGPNNTVMTDWCAGLQALAEAARLVREDEADVVIAGGAESGTLPFVFGSYRAAGLFSAGTPAEPAEPFLFGDAAALFVVEERAHAEARGARVLAEIAGSGSSASVDEDGAGAFSEHGSAAGALARAAGAALAEAGWDAEDVEAVTAAAPPVAAFRAAEAAALERVFGSRAAAVAIPSAAPRLGFALAAAAPVELALLLHSPAAANVTRALAISLGFLGQGACLAVQMEREA